MGHGDHWECILPSVDEAITRLIPEAINYGETVDGNSFCFTNRSGADWAEDGVDPSGPVPIGIVFDTGAYSILVLMLFKEVEGEKNWTLWSGYPFLTTGTRVELEITDISPWGNGVEAEITGSTSDGIEISYFDCFYFRDAEKYELGKRLTVELGALAFKARILDPQTIILEDPAVIEKLRSISGDFDSSKPLEIRTEGMAALLPIKGWDCYEYSFQGPVKKIEQMPGQENNFSRIVATVIRGEEDYDLPILVSQHVMDGALVEVGEDIAGHLWVHGQLVD